MIEFLGINSGALDGSLGRNGAEFLRREVFEFAAVTPHGRTRAADDGDVSGFQHEILLERGQMLGRKLISVAEEKLLAFSR